MDHHASKKQILKSTSIVGGAQVISVLAGVIRTKSAAIFLGVGGVGLAGLFQSTIDIIRGISTLGLPFSAVREIAKSSSKENESNLFPVVWVMRRLVFITGIIGTLVGIVFSRKLSIYTFGTPKYWFEITLCSFALFAYALSAGQLALLQGLRRLGDMTKASIFSLLISTLLSVLVYYFFGVDGIIPVIVGTAYIYLFFSWLFSKKVIIVSSPIDFNKSIVIAKSLLGLGIISLLSTSVELLTMYLTRTYIYMNSGVEQVGIFTAAWSISTLYLSMVLNSMGADFYPRLTSEIDNHQKMINSVQDQTEIAIFLSMPIITGMLFYSDWLIQLLYSKKFLETESILRWQFLGDFFKIMSWPLGFVLLAKGKGKLFLATNVSWSFSYLILIYILWPLLGLEITGIAFLACYFIYFLFVYWLAVRLINFSFSKKLVKIILLYAIVLTISFLLDYYVNKAAYHVIGFFMILFLIFFSYREINSIVNINRLFAIFKRKKSG